MLASKVNRLIKIILCGHISFIKTNLDKHEKGLIKSWVSGAIRFPSAQNSLELAIKNTLGENWSVRATNLGRSAIQIAIESMNLPPRSEIILSSFNCTGVIVPIIQAGHIPVFSDVDESFNISFDSVISLYSPKVRAIIVGHLSGCFASNIDRIIEWANDRGIYVIEDAAQAQGLISDGRVAGTIGNFGIFSCHGGKLTVSSGGGWVICKDPSLSRSIMKINLLDEPTKSTLIRVFSFYRNFCSNWGQSSIKIVVATIHRKLSRARKGASEYMQDYYFKTYKISDIEAKLALNGLSRIDGSIELRRQNAKHWFRLLEHSAFSGISHLPLENNIHLKVIVYAENGSETKLKILIKELENNGIEVEASYIPLHLRKPFSVFKRHSLPKIEAMYKSAICLPARPSLGSSDWIRINKAVQQAINTIETTFHD